MTILLGLICFMVGFLLGAIAMRRGFIISMKEEGYKVVYHSDRKAGEGRYKVYNMKLFDTGGEFEDD